MIWILILVMILIFFLLIPPKMEEKIINFANSKEEFIKKFMPYAIKVAMEYDFDPKIIAIHAGHETGWGKSVIDNNFFGIKATPSWKAKGGDSIVVKTHEYEEGKKKEIFAEFRAYKSIEECIRDYIELIKRNYPKAYENRKNYKKYFEYLQYDPITGKSYATDPLYSFKLKKTYELV